MTSSGEQKNNKSILDVMVLSGKVLKDKCWHTIWNFDLFEKVDRVYPNESYYDSIYNLIYTDADYILDNIFLGSAFNAADYKWLKSKDIKLIVNVAPGICNYYPNDFVYVNYYAQDINKSSLRDYYEDFYKNVKKMYPNNIFVHCFAGKSRSVALVLYYIMRERCVSLDEALAFIKKRRPSVNINTTFINEIEQIVAQNRPPIF